MKTFKVRVVKAGETDWYSDKIGQECSVIISGTDYYYTDGDGFYNSNGYLSKSDCVIVEDFKVGDRVRVTGLNDRDSYRRKEATKVVGEIGIITLIVRNDPKDFAGDIRINGKMCYFWSIRIEKLEDTMECTINGVTYRQLKEITVKALILAGAENGYVEHFDLSHNITEPILIKDAIDYALHLSYDFKKLVDNGFVEVVKGVEEEFRCRMGDRYKINGITYVLAKVLADPRTVNFVALSDGNNWSKPVQVNSFDSINRIQFTELTSPENWKKIYATRVPYKE